MSGILLCYTDSVKKAFIAEKLKLISEQLSKNESYLDVEQLKQCDDIRTFVNACKDITTNPAEIEELTKKLWKS